MVGTGSSMGAGRAGALGLLAGAIPSLIGAYTLWLSTGQADRAALLEAEDRRTTAETQAEASDRSWRALVVTCEGHALRANDAIDERRDTQSRLESCLVGRAFTTEDPALEAPAG